jgi:F-type H+-transporting ATPase subunit gamma
MDKIQEAVQAIASGDNTSSHPMLRERPVKRTGYVIITSDSGLAGPYNANIIKEITGRVSERHNDNPDSYDLFVIGRMGYEFLENRGYNITNHRIGLDDQPSFSSVKEIAQQSVAQFSNEDIDELYIVYNEYISVLEQKVSTRKLLPLSEDDAANQTQASNLSTYEFEPDKESILETILPQYAESLVYGALLEAKASEHAARMTAMKAATDNAKELVDDLSLQYNRARQAAITQEITEIVGGASALE